MRSPSQLRDRLRKQWHQASVRSARRSADPDAWPIELPIGLPTATDIRSRMGAVRRHLADWRSVRVGNVIWRDRSFRDVEGFIAFPTVWRIDRPSRWVAACDDRDIRSEFERMSSIIAGTDAVFHDALIRRRSLWSDKPIDEVVAACRVAVEIRPGQAAGRPLRSIGEFNTDTKFFERHRTLLTTLLDLRFNGQVSEVGLEAFLGAPDAGDHWVLVCRGDAADRTLPMPMIRVRTSDLASHGWRLGRAPGAVGAAPDDAPRALLIVENESCRHLLPPLPGVLVVLGCGWDVGWTAAECWKDWSVAYWGDIDTWGLTFLAEVRRNLPGVTALLTDRQTYGRHRDHAVDEPVPAAVTPPPGLSNEEAELYRFLLTSPGAGRLEQEFIAAAEVHDALGRWCRGGGFG